MFADGLDNFLVVQGIPFDRLTPQEIIDFDFQDLKERGVVGIGQSSVLRIVSDFKHDLARLALHDIEDAKRELEGGKNDRE